MNIGILGAGISGLTAAWYLKKKLPDATIALIEKSNRVGGWIRTQKVENFLFELGPRGFLSSGKGKATLALIEELGLQHALVQKKNKKRLLWHQGKLQPLNFAFLWKKKLFSLLWQEMKKPTSPLADESVGDFFERRFNAQWVADFVDPLVRGIFGGDPYTLSMRSCFPKWFGMEKAYGSLIKGYLSSKREKGLFYSFAEGMETLPNALAAQLEEKGVKILLNQENPSDHYDLLLSTLPDPAVKRLSLTLVHMGFHEALLPKKSFGYLTASRDEAKVLGVTFDSERQLCCMLRGEVEEEEAKSLAFKALEKHMVITKKPAVVLVTEARESIAQYEVGHYKKVEALASQKTIHIGTSYYGVGLNDCIFHASGVQWGRGGPR